MTCSIIGCDNPREGKTLFCASHNHDHRKEAREAKKVKIVRLVKKVNEKHADELMKYPKMRKEFLEFKMICEIGLEGCTRQATEIHHTAGRIGKNFLDIKTWKSACHSCHSKIHDVLSAEERRLKGFLMD